MTHAPRSAIVLLAATTACFGQDDPTTADGVAASETSTGAEASGAETGSSLGSDGSDSDGSSSEDNQSTTTTETTAADPECGNGVIEGGEACDDGNLDDGDACTSACQIAACDDGIHNGDESDLDCGGSCAPCMLGSACSEGADCESAVCSDMVCSLAQSCAHLHAEAPELSSGVYAVDVDGAGPTAAFDVMCEMDVDGGGWTLLQRTVWDPAETLPLMTNYLTWRTATLGSLDPNRGYRLAGMYWESFNGMKDHLLVHYMRRASDLQSCDPLYYKGTGGDFNIGNETAFLTGLISPVGMVSGTELSTTNSGPSQTCTNTHKGASWFYGGCCSTCPTFQWQNWTEPHPCMTYSTVPDLFGHTKLEVCGGDALPSLLGPAESVRGVNVMEYYIR